MIKYNHKSQAGEGLDNICFFLFFFSNNRRTQTK